MEHIARFEKDDSHTGLSVSISDSLGRVLEIFRRHRSMRLLAVLDANEWPIGVIQEIDVRDLLFNPFGHA